MHDYGREHRVVVTGVGLLTPVGNDLESAWSSLLSGTSGAGPITQFDATEEYATRIAHEVKGFDPTQYMERKQVKRNDRFVQFAVAVADEAMASAGLGDPEARKDLRPERFGVIFGSGIGGMYTFEDQTRVLVTKGPKRVSPFFVPMFIPDMASGMVSIRFGAKGPNYATVSACASSGHALGDALRILQRGDADVMLAGGTEAAVTPLCIAGFCSMKAMSTRNDDPTAASRPFDAGRDGFVIGEGAGAMVLETLEHAQARGATILAELAGYGASADAYHITAPEPSGAGAQFAMQAALDDAGANPEDVDYINAHGTSTPHNDAMETTAIKAVFGEHAHETVVGSTKSMVGHLLGAAGATEAIFCLLAIRDGKVPPTINFSEADPACDLDYAHNRVVERPVALALSNSFGFGGHNVTLAVRRWEE
ncbi:MAG: beta-ketoacyl-ACP synthase II [Gemmatimonadetes bacterium]|nr:beta-ketoacyl-ACP synthase II [Gemmatimonadota bacterium]